MNVMTIASTLIIPPLFPLLHLTDLFFTFCQTKSEGHRLALFTIPRPPPNLAGEAAWPLVVKSVIFLEWEWEPHRDIWILILLVLCLVSPATLTPDGREADGCRRRIKTKIALFLCSNVPTIWNNCCIKTHHRSAQFWDSIRSLHSAPVLLHSASVFLLLKEKRCSSRPFPCTAECVFQRRRKYSNTRVPGVALISWKGEKKLYHYLQICIYKSM